MVTDFYKYLEKFLIAHPSINQVLRSPDNLSHLDLVPPLVVIDPGVLSFDHKSGFADVSCSLYWLDTTPALPAQHTNEIIQDDTSLSNFTEGVLVLREVLSIIKYPVISETYQPTKFHGTDYLSGALLMVTFRVPLSFCFDTFTS